MEIAGITLIALSLSTVAFSVALGSSVYRCIEWGETFRMALVFALIHPLMAGLGWLIGRALSGWLSDMAYPVAVMIILLIGLRLLSDTRRRNPALRVILADDMKWLTGFAFLTGINFFLTGISLGMLTEKIFYILGLAAATVFLGVIAGVRLGKTGFLRSGLKTEAGGGVMLMVLSIIILLQYLNII